METFFKQNQHIRSIAANIELIWANRNIFVESKLKLDVLSVFIRSENIAYWHNLLNELHDHGLFKQLHVYCFPRYYPKFNQDSVNQLTSLKGFTKLSIEDIEYGTDLSPLVNLKQLRIWIPLPKR